MCLPDTVDPRGSICLGSGFFDVPEDNLRGRRILVGQRERSGGY